jgi:hypothetical protein
MEASSAKAYRENPPTATSPLVVVELATSRRVLVSDQRLSAPDVALRTLFPRSALAKARTNSTPA